MFRNSGKSWVEVWLNIGLAMLLIQIFLGGITRLTGSGLSITRWDIVTGIWFPVTLEDWNHQFELYKATPQFHKINRAFSLEDFKFIYFWEYFHRLWARLMGIVFMIPFCWFLFKKELDNKLVVRLIILILLAAFVASLGWIMVSSGLIERPWVNAYKLSFHLIAAVTTVAYLLWIILIRQNQNPKWTFTSGLHRLFFGICMSLLVQIFIGGVVAGMRAAIVVPTWPMMNGKWIPPEIWNGYSYSDYLFGQYEISSTGPVVIQFWHRALAYFISVLLIYAIVKLVKVSGKLAWRYCVVLGFLLTLQISLGIFTVLNSIGSIPLWLAVFHQLFGIVLFLYCLFIYWSKLPKSNNA